MCSTRAAIKKMLKMNEIIERILIIVGKVRTKAYNLGIRWP
jgi:hypothetical protein